MRYLASIKNTSEVKTLECRECKSVKPVYEFATYLNSEGERKHYRRCKSCYNEAQRLLRLNSGYTTKPRIKTKPFFCAKLGLLTKLCSKCGEVKPLDEFPKLSIKRGYHTACAVCMRRAHKEWLKKNPDKYIANRIKRIQRLLSAPLTEEINRDEIIERDARTCYLCGRKLEDEVITLDHVIPLARGGSHTASNLRVACLKCNSRKGAKLLHELDWINAETYATAQAL
ncbi:MAG TPA: HNH endonuclease [Pyrinomonadaceae bacterium]|jgi:5-methylcytosine-specific restriction endonuclease McrA